MNPENRLFLQQSQSKIADKNHYRKLDRNISKYEVQYNVGKSIFRDYDYARERAGYTKFRAIQSLERMLSDFELKFTANGGKVIWAETADDAMDEIVNIFKNKGVKMVVKSKSMITEELNVNERLEREKIESIETDLGEFIVQAAGEKPYHILTPAIHKSKEDVAALFASKFKMANNSTPEEITQFVRAYLREKFISADASITGANFIIPETGSICITENEGNAMMCYAFPRIHIVVAGIERVLPKIEDLDLFWHLLAVNGTGQHLTSYNSIISGPRKSIEYDGPDEMYVVLINNGRTNVIAETPQRLAASCIRCGACLNACPIYKNIGGHSYGVTYTGPIGSVISPLMFGFKQFHHLSYACTQCGKCTEVCAVKLPLHELIIENRKKAFRDKHIGLKWSAGIKVSQKILTQRKQMDRSPALKNLFMRMFVRSMWGKDRELPIFANKTFKQMMSSKF